MINLKEQLDTLLNTVTDNCDGLFIESQRYQETFENGRYGCAFLRPTKKLRANIGVERELLLVSSTFHDQQTRSLRFIVNEIEKSSGRLENTIAIIVHRDKDGNLKLRNWGRELGISIIAINTAIRSNNELERLLSAHLYAHDPFDISGPVSSDTSFFGRREEAIDLARKLQAGQIRSCLGIRKIGKTSIINRVLLEIRKSHDCVCVMVDCSRDEVFSSSAEELLLALADSVNIASIDGTQYCSLQTIDGREKLNLIEARDLLENAVCAIEKPVIIVFDEIDYITPGSPTSVKWPSDFNRFWRALRTIYQECTRNNTRLSLLIGGVSTYWFSVPEIDGVENAALAFVPEEFLSPMPTRASAAMLRRLGKVSGLMIAENAARYIAQSTGNIPFWSRKCASFIHRHIDYDIRPVSVEKPEVVPLVERFIVEEGAAIAEVALTHLFRVHPHAEQSAAALFAKKHSELPAPHFRTLCRYGIAEEDGSFSGSMFETAYRSLIATKINSSVQSSIPRTKNDLSDWAEELSLLGRRRNILEKRLRSIVLNFLRMDALKTGELNSLRDKILKALPAGRASKLNRNDIEHIMEKLFWKELIVITIKRWDLFGGIFDDKRLFEANCEIINDRPDAHAKPMDQADFALYRRALSHIEERLSKLG